MFKLEKWEEWCSRDCFGPDYSGWYVLYARGRDFGALVDSNFVFCCNALGIDADGSEKDTPTRKVIRVSHWLVGWVEWVGFHKSDTEAMDIAQGIIKSLSEYPVLDEEGYSSLEDEYGEDEYDVEEE